MGFVPRGTYFVATRIPPQAMFHVEPCLLGRDRLQPFWRIDRCIAKFESVEFLPNPMCSAIGPRRRLAGTEWRRWRKERPIGTSQRIHWASTSTDCAGGGRRAGAGVDSLTGAYRLAGKGARLTDQQRKSFSPQFGLLQLKLRKGRSSTWDHVKEPSTPRSSWATELLLPQRPAILQRLFSQGLRKLADTRKEPACGSQ